MNRIQFWALTGACGLVFILVVAHIILVRQFNEAQAQVAMAQQRVNQGQAAQSMMKQLAVRIYQDSEKNHDQKLKDLLKRQSISYNAGSDTNSTDTPAAPTTH